MAVQRDAMRWIINSAVTIREIREKSNPLSVRISKSSRKYKAIWLSDFEGGDSIT